MKKGYLSEYFTHVATKRLSAVEANPHRSNQHEFNGDRGLKGMFGTDRETYGTTFIYLSDDDPEPITERSTLTWYDARENHPTRTEFRLYFPTTNVSSNANEGDLLVIGRRPDNSILLIIAEAESTIENQILWLFGFSDLTHPGFSVKGELESDQVRLEFASRYILEQIGIEVETTDENYLEQMLEKFEGSFPTTRIFSEYARSTISDIDLTGSADEIIMAWLEREEVLFRTLERHIIGDRLRQGFDDDVDSFVSYSLSVQNRRKSRAGGSLENHLEQIFKIKNISYSRTAITENRNKPDFIFPDIASYHNPAFPEELLSMLGAKSTCKDRWRQILPEANRIKTKHLFTLEPGISENQTNEMISKNVQLVLPSGIHGSYSAAQQDWIINLDQFIEELNNKYHSH